MLMSPALAYGSSPLGLPWGKEIPNSYSEYKDYKYLWGDTSWGAMRFLGWLGEDFRSEVLLTFTGKKIGKAYLLLGPEGITDSNCFKQYRKIVNGLNKKYGQYYRRNLTKESIIEDLVFVNECYAMRVGVAEIETKWRIDNFEINAFMFSDENELYIEVEYIYLPLNKIQTENIHEHL